MPRGWTCKLLQMCGFRSGRKGGQKLPGLLCPTIGESLESQGIQANSLTNKYFT